MIIVAINSFNYANYISEAVQSALKQTKSPDLILVVDDGSTDNTVQLLGEEFGVQIEVISKENEGQLSCFNEICSRIKENDLVFFLDADDRFLPNHIERCLSIYDSNPNVNYVFTRHMMFGSASGSGEILCKMQCDLGHSVFSTRELEIWLGGPTSTLSMKGTILKRFLPCPLEADWKVRADDVLVMGSSLAGARKYFLNEMTVEYRVHASNHFCNRKESPAKAYQYTLRKRRMLAFISQQLNMPYSNEVQLAAIEFKLCPQKSFSEFQAYFRIVLWLKGSFVNKLHAIASLTKSMFFGS